MIILNETGEAAKMSVAVSNWKLDGMNGINHHRRR